MFMMMMAPPSSGIFLPFDTTCTDSVEKQTTKSVDWLKQCEIDNKIIEQVNSFNYLGNMISYEKELDIDNKLHNYLKITGIINNVFRPQKNP